MRTLSLNFRKAIFSEQTGDVAIILLTISHPLLVTPERVSSDPTKRISIDPLIYGTRSRGNDYLFLPISGILPDDKEDSPPQARLVIENISRDLIGLLRSTTIPATVDMEIVLASAPDFVEIVLPELDLISADYDMQSVTLGLSINALQNEPFPGDAITPSNFPGLF